MIQKKIILILLGILILSNCLTFVSAGYVTVYNKTNFTKPTNLTSPISVKGYNSTQDLPTREDNENEDKIIVGKPQVIYQLPPGFKIPDVNLSVFTNDSNITNVTNQSKSLMDKLDENPPLKYGLIIFLIIIIILVAYIIYLNYGESVTETISFGGDFAPSGHI